MRLDDLLGDRQPEPGPRRALVADPIGVEERIEHLLRLVGEHPLALIVDLEIEPRRVARHAQQHVASVRAELDCVVDQIPDRLLQLALVAPPGRRMVDSQFEHDPARLRLQLLLVDDRARHRLRLERVAVDGVPAALQRGEIDQVVDGAREPLRRHRHRLDDLLLRLAQRARLPGLENLQVAGDRRQRRRQLVREVLHELGLAAGGGAQARVGGGQFAHRRFQPLDQRLRVFA